MGDIGVDQLEKLCLWLHERELHVEHTCGPCGHGLVLRVVPLLVRGFEPGSYDWERLHSTLPDVDWRTGLGPLDRDAVLVALESLRLERLDELVPARYWAHTIAILMEQVVELESKSGRLTRALTPQLLAMVGEEGAAGSRLRHIISLVDGVSGVRLMPQDVLDAAARLER